MFLLLPGFFSGFVGVVLLVPISRNPLAAWKTSVIRRRITVFLANADSGMRDFAHSDQPCRRPFHPCTNGLSAGEADFDLEMQQLDE